MTKHRYISNYIVYRSKLYVNNVMSIDGCGVTLEKVNDELAHTEYVAGIIAIVGSDNAAEAVMQYVGNGNGDKQSIIEYLESTGEPKLPELPDDDALSVKDLILLQIVAEEKIVKRICR